MVIRTRRDKEKELTLLLYRSEAESNRPRPIDLLEPFQQKGITTKLLAKNPVTDEVWAIIIDLAKNHGQGTVIIALIVLWLKEKLGRRIEIERGDFKITAPTAKELEKALLTLDKYDKLNLTINNSKPNKQQPKKQTKKQGRPAKA